MPVYGEKFYQMSNLIFLNNLKPFSFLFTVI